MRVFPRPPNIGVRHGDGCAHVRRRQGPLAAGPAQLPPWPRRGGAAQWGRTPFRGALPEWGSTAGPKAGTPAELRVFTVVAAGPGSASRRRAPKSLGGPAGPAWAKVGASPGRGAPTAPTAARAFGADAPMPLLCPDSGASVLRRRPGPRAGRNAGRQRFSARALRPRAARRATAGGAGGPGAARWAGSGAARPPARRGALAACDPSGLAGRANRAGLPTLRADARSCALDAGVLRRQGEAAVMAALGCRHTARPGRRPAPASLPAARCRGGTPGGRLIAPRRPPGAFRAAALCGHCRAPGFGPLGAGLSANEGSASGRPVWEALALTPSGAEPAGRPAPQLRAARLRTPRPAFPAASPGAIGAGSGPSWAPMRC